MNAYPFSPLDKNFPAFLEALEFINQYHPCTGQLRCPNARFLLELGTWDSYGFPVNIEETLNLFSNFGMQCDCMIVRRGSQYKELLEAGKPENITIFVKSD